MPRHVLLRDVRHTFRLAETETALWPASRAGLSILLPLLCLLWFDRLDLMAGALFGGFVSLYGRGEPYPRRARTLAVVGIGLVAAVAAGGTVSAAITDPTARELAAALVLTAFATTATAASTATKLGPPGGLIFAFAVGACAHLPLTWASLGQLTLVAIGSAVLGWSLSLAGTLVDRFAPQRRAVSKATHAVAAHLDDGTEASWHTATTTVRDAWHALALTRGKHRHHPGHARLTHAVHHCEAALTTPASTSAAELRALARSIRRPRTDRTNARTTGPPRAHHPPTTPVPRSRALRGTVAATVRGRHHEWGWVLAASARVAVSSLLAVATANLLGIGHAYWAAVSAVAVLQATSAARSLPRLLQRSTGTIIGVAVGAVVLHLDPAPWLGVLLVAVFQWAAEMNVMRNYAIGVSFATPVALLASTLPLANVADDVALNRLWATLLGAGVAIVIARVVPNRAAVLARFDRALNHVHRVSRRSEIDLGQLAAALAELREAYDALTGEMSNTAERAELLAEATRTAHRRARGGTARIPSEHPVDAVTEPLGWSTATRPAQP